MTEATPTATLPRGALAGLRVLLTGDGADERRAALGIGPDSVVVMLVTEGADANPVPQEAA